MPNTIRNFTAFLGSNSNPDTVNITPPTPLTGGGTPPGSFFPYAGGELGGTFEVNDKCYTLVTNDSGATSATPTGAVAANQLAFWKDKAARIVTNDSRFALSGQTANGWRNSVAGVYRNAAGAGNLIFVLTRGYNIPVASDGTGGPGQNAIADGGATTPRVVAVALGTAPGYQSVGIMRGSPGGGNVVVDVDIPTLP